MFRLDGKVALVTGAARGLGKCTASNFAREGSRLVITDIDAAELERTAGEMSLAGHETHPYVTDISDRDACLKLAEKVRDEVGQVDVLVNNAAIALNERILDMSEEAFRRITDVNLLGQVWMMQAFVPEMVRRGRGHVVNICSILGKVAVPRLGAYTATKFAFAGLTDTIRQELRGSGVDFTIVNPGYIATGMFEGAKVPIITSWQDPQHVADALLEAVKKNRAEIYVPRFMTRLSAILRAINPRIVDLSFVIFGANKAFDTMKKDRGRPF